MPTLSVKELGRHTPRPREVNSLRAMIPRPSGPVAISVRPVDISVLTQNMGLLVFPGDYLGTDREGAIAEIIARIRALAPDVVGLCEVFADGERDRIRHALADLYPQFREGPDEGDLESDGGLLLLCRHPLFAAASFIYRMCDGADCFANKGMIHIRTKAPAWPSAIDFFYTHAQDISTPHGAAVLHAQVEKMRDFMTVHRDRALPAIVMGDLNIPAGEPEHYGHLMETLFMRDAWTILGNRAGSGPTSIRDNNFYEDPDDRPARDQRLDYVLLRAGMNAVPIVAECEPVRFEHNGRLISDHLAVRARFDRMAMFHSPPL